MIFEQWIVIGAQVLRRALAGSGTVEHAAQRDAVHIVSVYPEANDPPSELIHDDDHPMGVQQNGLTAKEIDAPEAVFRVPKERQPGGPTIAKCWAIMFGEDTPHNVLVDLDTEGLGDDQGDPRAAESGIALLELDDRPNKLWRWTFGTGLVLPVR